VSPGSRSRGAWPESSEARAAAPAGSTKLSLHLPTNLASGANGATATGDGVDQANLIDDTEATNWASLSGDVAGEQVTVRLDPSRDAREIGRVQVSALLHPAIRPTRAARRGRSPQPDHAVVRHRAREGELPAPARGHQPMHRHAGAWPGAGRPRFDGLAQRAVPGQESVLKGRSSGPIR
jgi:hypothetical protein